MQTPALILMPLFAPVPSDSTLTPAERRFATEYLQQTQLDFMQALEGLTPAQLTFKPDPEAWSIAECAQHIALTEQRLFDRAMESLREPSNPARRSEINTTDQGVIDKMTDRSWKGNAPEAIQPGDDKFPDLETATFAFMDRRDQTIQYLEHTNDDLRSHYMKHGAYGIIDTYQVFLLMGAHCKRHILQMEDVKKHPNYPKQ